MTLPCTCRHRGQDKLHGPGRRVMNPCKQEKGGNSGQLAPMWKTTTRELISADLDW